MPLTDPEYKRKKITQDIKKIVYERDNGKCKQCGSDRDLQFDHILPHSKGGSDEVENLQILCKTCNSKKSNKIQ